MGSSGAEAYRKRLEQAARLKAAGAPEHAGYKLPEGLGPAQKELEEKRRKVSAADKADYLVRDAMNRGEFENLQYAGKPIPGLDDPDPDWWIKRLIKRENITGLGPPALQLRVEDAEFATRLDRLPSERQVREAVDDFNARVVEARRQLLGGPPVVTRTREAETEVRGWRQRRGLPVQDSQGAQSRQGGQDRQDRQGSQSRQDRHAAADGPLERPAQGRPRGFSGWTGRLRRRLLHWLHAAR